MTAAASRDLGTFPVIASQDEVAAFRAATRCGDFGARPPLTFPMRWLAQPDVRGALLEMVSDADLIPVHESQTFEYLMPLSCDEPYVMALAARREVGPDRLVADGVVTGADGMVRAKLEMILRLFSGEAAAA